MRRGKVKDWNRCNESLTFPFRTYNHRWCGWVGVAHSLTVCTCLSLPIGRQGNFQVLLTENPRVSSNFLPKTKHPGVNLGVCHWLTCLSPDSGIPTVLNNYGCMNDCSDVQTFVLKIESYNSLIQPMENSQFSTGFWFT